MCVHVHCSVCLPFAFRMEMRWNRWGGSAFLMLVALAWFPAGVEGACFGPNMGACNTCEASCRDIGYCGRGCALFLGKGYSAGDYPTLASCKAECGVSPQMNRPNVTLLCGVCVCRKRGVCVCGWRGVSSCSFLTHTRPASGGVPL